MFLFPHPGKNDPKHNQPRHSNPTADTGNDDTGDLSFFSQHRRKNYPL